MSITKNYLYNMVYQVFVLLVPLVTMTYIARVLGSKGAGINAYTNSIIQYFILIGTIGVAIYGNRSIAYVRDNKDELSRIFWSIFTLKLITTAIAYICFLIFLLIVNNYQFIYLLQSIYIISATFDITWLFMGLEDFRKTVLRNIFVKTLGAVSIFIFIHDTSDLWKYVLLLALSELLGQLTMWWYLPKTVKWVKVKWDDVKKHFLPAASLFLPQAAIQIYAVLNKPMLGYLSNANEVGYFDYADKIIKMVLAIVTAMGVVMLPRVSNTFAKGEMDKVKEYLNQSLEFVTYLSLPMMFGLAGIANEFVPWFFGQEFQKTGLLMAVISPIIVLIAWSNVLGFQYLMPTKQTRLFTISVIAGAIINFTFNLILIPLYQSVGTALSTILAEFTVTFVQIYYVRKNINFIRISRSVWKFLVAGIMTYIVARLIGLIMKAGFLTTITQVIFGSLIYFVVLFLLRSQMNKKLFNKVFKIIIKLKVRQ